MNIKIWESAVLPLALERGHEMGFVDEEAFREVARLHNMEPHGALGVLFDVLDECEIGFDEFVDHVEQLLEAVFHPDGSLYLEVIRYGRRLSKR